MLVDYEDYKPVQPSRKPLLYRLYGFIGRIGCRLLTWHFMQIAPYHKMDPKAVRMIAMQEENAIWDSIRGRLLWGKTEADILSARLGRRYDLGAALNEAANRAMEDKAVQKSAPKLSENQLKALEFQKEYLQRIVKNS